MNVSWGTSLSVQLKRNVKSSKNGLYTLDDFFVWYGGVRAGYFLMGGCTLHRKWIDSRTYYLPIRYHCLVFSCSHSCHCRATRTFGSNKSCNFLLVKEVKCHFSGFDWISCCIFDFILKFEIAGTTINFLNCVD